MAGCGLKDSPVLLLDEATSSVDALAEGSIRQATQEFQRGRTTIIVTHRLEAVRDLPRILVLDRGTTVADGSHDELMARGGLYENLVLRRHENDMAVA